MDRQQQLMVTRILWGALSFGPLAFAAVAVFVIVPTMPADADPAFAKIFLYAVAVLAVVMIALSRFLPPKLLPATSGQAPETLHRTRTIVASALCEGACLFAVMAFIMCRDRQVLMVGVLPYMGLLGLFPSLEQIEAIEREQQDGARG